ncbi:MAG: hypothetical protein LWX01_06040 [Deltaproteobacteria bacterium]|nr:hypothetical protein [Deltaproteobacteria bacterium]MDL1961247.1 hypothetical protein [Deltaproteobacteria bacterium]
MKKLLLLTILAALLSAPQSALCYGDGDDWYEQQKMERQQRDMEDRFDDIERKQRDMEFKQWQIENQRQRDQMFDRN